MVHKLDQLWTLREEQLHKNRQLSAEFVQFEKDTREVSLTLCSVFSCSVTMFSINFLLVISREAARRREECVCSNFNTIQDWLRS